MHFSIDRTVHTTAFDKPVVDHWLERKIARTAAGSTEKNRSDDRPLQRRARYRLSYIPLSNDRITLMDPFSKWICRDPTKTERTPTRATYNKCRAFPWFVSRWQMPDNRQPMDIESMCSGGGVESNKLRVWFFVLILWEVRRTGVSLKNDWSYPVRLVVGVDLLLLLGFLFF